MATPIELYTCIGRERLGDYGEMRYIVRRCQNLGLVPSGGRGSKLNTPPLTADHMVNFLLALGAHVGASKSGVLSDAVTRLRNLKSRGRPLGAHLARHLASKQIARLWIAANSHTRRADIEWTDGRRETFLSGDEPHGAYAPGCLIEAPLIRLCAELVNQPNGAALAA